MKTKTFVILAVLGTITVIGYNLGTRLLHAAAFHSFTATMITTTYSADFPTLSLTVTEDDAVRADGSSVRIQYPLGGRMIDNTPATWRGVFDFSTGRLTVVHPEISATVTTKLGAIEHAVQYHPQYTCPGSDAGQILGFDVQLSQKTEDLIPSPGPGAASADH